MCRAGDGTNKHQCTDKSKHLRPEVAFLIFGFAIPEHAVEILLSVLRIVRLCGLREQIFGFVPEQVELKSSICHLLGDSSLVYEVLFVLIPFDRSTTQVESGISAL